MTDESSAARLEWDQILATLTDAWPAEHWCDVGVLVGCSGGGDSVALVRALVQLRNQRRDARGFLCVAHFNHRLRGTASDDDETFVRQLAGQLGVGFEIDRGQQSASDEATLRTQRLQFLLATAKRIGARYIAVGHTLDDNVETVLHHLMRGTGPRGLAGIAPVRPLDDDFVLIRPLLSVKRQQLRSGLKEIGQIWRDDATNAQSDYRRNWIRNELIPMMQSRFPDVVAAIGRAADGQWIWRQSIDRQAQRWLADHRQDAAGILLRRDSQADPAIVIAALQQLWDQQNWPRQEMARPQWTRLATTLSGSQSARFWMPASIEVVAEGDTVKINPPRR